MQSPLRISRIQLSRGQIFWREVGRGTALVFLHGAYNDSSQWLNVIDRLEGDYHCFAPDLLGFGDSEAPNVHHSINLQVECLAEYLEALRLERVYLIGHSVGGWIAASFAARYRERVEGLILIAPEGMAVDEQEGRWELEKLLVSPIPAFYWLLKAIAPVAKFLGLRHKINELLTYRSLLLENSASCQLLFDRHPVEIQQEYLNGWENEKHNQKQNEKKSDKSANKLAELPIPTLILQGGRDRPERLAQSKAYARAIKTAKFRMMKNGDANLIAGWPDSIASEIQWFVRMPAPARSSRR